MKKLRLLLLFLPVCSLHLQAQFLHADGKAIVNEKGDNVLLRGMGLGGWMLQEGYMFHLSNIGQQYRIREKINELVGPALTEKFYQQWLLQHTTKADIDSMAAWGFNSVRIPLHYNLFTLPVEKEKAKSENTWLTKGFALTDSLLRWCAANKMYLILDMHATPGGQGNDLAISDRDPAKPSLWDSKENQQKLVELWAVIAKRYKDEPWIGGYDIINEPNWGFEDTADKRGITETHNIPLRQLMVDITKYIRRFDRHHMIIIEGNGFGNNYNGILPAWDDNMVLSFHRYGNFNTTDRIRKYLDLRNRYNVPIWLGETGENSNTWYTESIALMEKNNIGWSWWQLKKMGINNPLEIKMPEGYDTLLAYWSGKGARPSKKASWLILQNLLENIKIEQNIFHRDVIDAMFRQVADPTAIPYVQQQVKDGSVVAAVDFDLGPQGIAYFDRDSAHYQYEAGDKSNGNKGRVYRNDGIDIRMGSSGPYIFSIEDGEWMQYTLDIKDDGNYDIILSTATEEAGGALTFIVNNQVIVSNMALPVSADGDHWQHSTIPLVSLRKGKAVVKILAAKGGFTFRQFRFEKKN